MNFSNIKHNLMTLADKSAMAHPVTFVYTTAFVSLALGITIWSVIGWCLGSLTGHPVTGMYLGLAIYSYLFTFNVQMMKAKCNQTIEELKEMSAFYASL